MEAREASEQLFKLEVIQNRRSQNQSFWSSGIVEEKQLTELEWMANMIFEFSTLQMEVIFLVFAH